MSRYKEYVVTKTCNGWLYRNKKQWTYVEKATIAFDWLYNPIGTIGFDLNKTDDTFVVFSHCMDFIQSKYLPSPKEIINLSTDLKKLLNETKNRKLLLSIDGLSCGKKTGSFGHDALIETLIKGGENQRIPFVVCPTPYTTKQCNICKTITEKLTPEDRKWQCENCEEHHIRDENAAINISNSGWDIWKNGIKKFSENFYHKYGKNPVKRLKTG